MKTAPHLFVDISSHGFGHLAITAPVLIALKKMLPDLQLTLRSALPPAQLAERLPLPYTLIAEASDFGYHMHNTLQVDLDASAEAYRKAHANWPERIQQECDFLSALAPDLVLSNVSYLPLAAARQAGIPAYSMCCLNWADLFAHYFGHDAWAAPIYREMLEAYGCAARFLRVSPGMPMDALPAVQKVGIIAALGTAHALPEADKHHVLVAMGGIQHRLPIENWPRLPNIRWLVPAAWNCHHPDCVAFESLGLTFTDLLASVDAVVTKPGYGTFTEACCNGTPVLYQRRDDWPEQDCLIDWLESHGRAREISRSTLTSGQLAEDLAQLWALPQKPPPQPTGALEVAQTLHNFLMTS